MDLVSVLLIAFSAAIAFFTWRTAQIAHDLSMLQQSLTNIMDSFEKRYSDEKYNELELLIVQKDPSEVDFLRGEHYILVRTLNYYLKPIAAWCEVALMHKRKNYAAAHKMFASIILTSLHSRQHVLLFILQALDARTPNNIRAHRPILKYIKEHVKVDWHETLMGNRTNVVTRLQSPPWI